MKELYKDLVTNISSYMMTTEQLERKYDLKLGHYILDWDLTNYYAERAFLFTQPQDFWIKVSSDSDLTFSFIDLYKDFLKWDIINYEKWKYNLNFARTFAEYIDWWVFSEKFIASNDASVIREFIDYIHIKGNYIKWEWNNLDINLIREYDKKVNWFDITNHWVNAKYNLKETSISAEYFNQILAIFNEEGFRNTNLLDNIKFDKKTYQRFKQPYILQRLIWYNALDETVLDDIVKEHASDDEIIDLIIKKCTLSEKFIEDHFNIFNKRGRWRNISIHQKLSEDFIEKYANKLSWVNILKYQQVSEKFVEEHLSYAKKDLNIFINNNNVSERFLNKHIHLLNPANVAINQFLSDDFINKHFNNNQYLANIAKEKRRV